LCQQHGLPREAGTLTNALGELARQEGDFARAVTLYKEALTIATEVGLPSDRLLFLSNLAGAQVGAGDYETAVINLQSVINEMEATWFNMPETYRFLAEAFLGLNQLDDALNAGQTSLRLALATGSPDLIGYAWQVLGRVAVRSGKPVVAGGQLYDATACFDKSAAIFQEAGMESDYAWTQHYRAQGKSLS